METEVKHFTQYPGFMGNLLSNYTKIANHFSIQTDLKQSYKYDAYYFELNKIKKVWNLGESLFVKHICQAQFNIEYFAVKTFMLENYPGEKFDMDRDDRSSDIILRLSNGLVLYVDVFSPNPLSTFTNRKLHLKLSVLPPNAFVLLFDGKTDYKAFYEKLSPEVKTRVLIASPLGFQKLCSEHGISYNIPKIITPKSNDYISLKSLDFTVDLDEGLENLKNQLKDK